MACGLRRLALLGMAASLGLLCASCSQDDGSGAGGERRGKGARGGAQGGKGGVEFADSFQRIRIEAESGEIISDDAYPEVGGKVMRIVDDSGASGGKCVWIPDKAGTPTPPEGQAPKYARAVYKFNVKVAGKYAFWCRRKWLDSCGDSLAVRFDSVGKPHSEAFRFGDCDSKPVRWAWSTVTTKEGTRRDFQLAAGEHVMEILNTEDGPCFDVILLTDEPGYVAQGMEE